MTAKAPVLTIFGGSGFVGRYITQRMAKQGWRIRVAVRRPNEALFVKPYGAVGQVEPILANIKDEASVRAAIKGSDAVVNAVRLVHGNGQKYDKLEEQTAALIARVAAEEQISNLVYISGIGANPEGKSVYEIGKGLGETRVLEAFPSATILRPSVIFGIEDEFFNKLAVMARLMPLVFAAHQNTRLQPVYVDDIAQACEKILLGKAPLGVYELGGPDIETFGETIDRVIDVIERKRFRVPMPSFIARIMASLLDFAQFATLGLYKNKVLTREQLKMMVKDNVVSADAKGFKDLGILPTSMDIILPEYLYMYRPYGQYAELTRSSKNLRAD